MKTKKETLRIFIESPYDIETVHEALKIASKTNKELIFLDRLIATLRLDPYGDVVNITYKILLDLKMINLNGDYNEQKRIR